MQSFKTTNVTDGVRPLCVLLALKSKFADDVQIGDRQHVRFNERTCPTAGSDRRSETHVGGSKRSHRCAPPRFPSDFFSFLVHPLVPLFLSYVEPACGFLKCMSVSLCLPGI